MEIKEIKEQYAKECGYDSWEDLYLECLHTGIDAHIDDIATRYAQQFQPNTDLITTEICVLRERVAELEEHMKECASVLSWVLDNARPDSDWQTFTNSVMNAIVEANSLINKGKDNG